MSEVIAAGMLPAAMEMMDGQMVQVVEDAFHFGFPADTARRCSSPRSTASTNCSTGRCNEIVEICRAA